MKNGRKALFGILVIFILGGLTYGEDAQSKDALETLEKNTDGSVSKGFNISVPAYLYAQYSTFGVQAGYQFNNAHIRLDMNFAENFINGQDVWFFMPSIGVFYSMDFQSVFRLYEGLTFGIEKGMLNSFKGVIGFINYIAGAEFLSFGNRTFFIEVGTGVSFTQEEGAYLGGTVIGGGFKYYF